MDPLTLSLVFVAVLLAIGWGLCLLEWLANLLTGGGHE